MNQDIRFCTTVDGVRLAYALSGDGPPLVFSLTWMNHLEASWQSLAWRQWLEAFSGDYRLLRHDARGCGLSERNPGELSFEAWVCDLKTVIDAAAFDQFSILATCQGGAVAIEYAARHSERVRKLVLFGACPLGRKSWHDRPREVEKTRVLADLARVGWAQENHLLLQLWAQAYQPGGKIEHLRSWSEQQRASTSAETAARLFEIGWNMDVREAARRIKCPVLVVHAERDAVVPVEIGRQMAGLIPGARFVALDSENHMPLADEPAWQRLVREVRGFLDEPAPARAPVPAGRRALALDELTPRERAVLEEIAAGLDNAEIAASLRVSEKTVRNHITRVFDKIGVRHRYDAIVRAREAGLANGKVQMR